jgi:hypothetical protein
VISSANELTTDIEVVTGPEPPSHTLTTWIALHGRYKDNSCKACHTTPASVVDLYALDSKPEVDDSFCGNEACHGNVWTYAGFDAPELEPILSEQLAELVAQRAPQPAAPAEDVDAGDLDVDLTYDGAIGEMLVASCSTCHGASATAGLDVTSYQSLLAGGDSGPGVVPDDLQASLVYLRQSEETPHYVQLDEGQLKLLEDWILAGAPEN